MSSRQLFRQEALDFHRAHSQWGSVSALQPTSLKTLSWLIVAAAIAVVAFIILATYARKETALGYLTPSKGTAKIFVPRPGTIRDVQVKEGDRVEAGQSLLTLDINQIAGDGSDVNAALLATLEEQRQHLASNIAAETERTTSEDARLKSIVAGLEAELRQLEAQRRIQQERLEVVRRELAAGVALSSKGYMTLLELRKRQTMELEQKQAVSSVAQRIEAKTKELKDARFNLSQLPTVMEQRIQVLRNQLADAEQRTLEVEGRRAQVIRAPVSGRITTLQAKVGQSAEPTRLQLEIVPAEAELQAELFLPARAIGFVEVGQPVRILYDAFPYQHFGTYRGNVISVSQTLLTPGNAAGPIQLNQPSYRVIAALERETVDANGKAVALQPDMLLKADIILERRSLASWLTQPLRSVRM